MYAIPSEFMNNKQNIKDAGTTALNYPKRKRSFLIMKVHHSNGKTLIDRMSLCPRLKTRESTAQPRIFLLEILQKHELRRSIGSS